MNYSIIPGGAGIVWKTIELNYLRASSSPVPRLLSLNLPARLPINTDPVAK